MIDVGSKPISALRVDVEAYEVDIERLYGKALAPADLWLACDAAKRLSLRAKMDPALVWEELLFTDNYYRMPKIYAVVDERGRTKIGQTESMEARLAGLQVGNADRLRVAGFVPCPSWMETRIHRYLEKYNVIGEWFKKHKKVAEVVDCIANKDRRSLYGLLEIKYVDPEQS